MDMKNLSVFGGFGFVGSEFIRQNLNVYVQKRSEYVPVNSNILNFISTVHNYNVWADPYLDIDTNLNVMIKILEYARKNFGKDTIFNQISSWFVYGKTDCPAKESSVCSPNGFYSITKYASELLLKSYCETFGMKYRILRLSNVIGVVDEKASRKKNALQHMIRQVSVGEDIDYLYQGDFYRDYIDVRDCSKAIRLVLDGGNLNEVYNIGNGVPVNINDTVYYANKVAGERSKISLMEVPEFHKTVQVKDMWLDTSKIKNLGYKPEYSVKDTVRGLVDYYSNGR